MLAIKSRQLSSNSSPQDLGIPVEEEVKRVATESCRHHGPSTEKKHRHGAEHMNAEKNSTVSIVQGRAGEVGKPNPFRTQKIP